MNCLQFQPPGNFIAHAQSYPGFKLSGTAFQPVIFNRGQTLDIRHAFIRARQPAHARQLHFIITTTNLRRQRHAHWKS